MEDVPTSPSEEDLNNPGSPKEDEADENFFTRTTKKWPFKIDHAWAEFCAMMLFVFIGCGAASHNTDVSGRFYSQSSSLGPDWTLLVALAFGISIMVLASATLHTSGGQINCAVTLGLVISGALPWQQGLANFVGQMLGSIAGACLLLLATSGETEDGWEARDFTGGLGSNGLNPRYSAGNAFVNEAMMTFLLLFVVFEVAVNKKSEMFNVAPLAIGFAVFVAHLVCLPVTGCSINPTRSFGPALVATFNGTTGLWEHMWIFWVAPCFGAVLAAFIRGRPIVAMNQRLFANAPGKRYNQRR